MSAQHTPGPWLSHPAGKKLRILASNRAWLAEAYYAPEADFSEGDISWSAAHANARLIAAAPELLEALRKALHARVVRDGDVVDAMHAAITKATGGGA